MKRFLFLATIATTLLFNSCGNQQQSADNAASKPHKKVLIISSSPRKGGNSDLLCDQFMKGAQGAGHEVEKVFLNDLNIRFLQTNDDYDDRSMRTQADDAPMVVDKMIEADVIVLATPIYYYNMSGQMLTMMDRLFEREHELKDKEFYFIMASGDPDCKAMDCALLGFRNFLRASPTSREMGVIYGTGASSKGEIADKPVMQEAFEMGGNS